jgi:hypothetical protein
MVNGKINKKFKKKKKKFREAWACSGVALLLDI